MHRQLTHPGLNRTGAAAPLPPRRPCLVNRSACRLAGTPVADPGDPARRAPSRWLLLRDYLRCGAIAQFAPVMTELVPAARAGLPVLGICNGFQILCEAHLLPRRADPQRGPAVHHQGPAAAGGEHNHPSYVEPHQGAATGVSGIVRDILAMGARPVAVMDALRFGPAEAPDTGRVLPGVVSGISFYGNYLGLPNIGGELDFDLSYAGNSLVNALCVGGDAARRAVGRGGPRAAQQDHPVRVHDRPGWRRRHLGAGQRRASVWANAQPTFRSTGKTSLALRSQREPHQHPRTGRPARRDRAGQHGHRGHVRHRRAHRAVHHRSRRAQRGRGGRPAGARFARLPAAGARPPGHRLGRWPAKRPRWTSWGQVRPGDRPGRARLHRRARGALGHVRAAAAERVPVRVRLPGPAGHHDLRPGVHATRVAVGRRLAAEHPADADLVIPVPESGTPAAIGFAEASGIPFGQGLVKNYSSVAPSSSPARPSGSGASS